MSKALRPSGLVPPDFAVESAVAEGSGTIITVRAVAVASRCPPCGGSTRRVHSRYLRTVFDLPLSGRAVRLVVQARRFRCDVVRCSRTIFTERFAGEILRPWSRRTVRVDDLAHHLGLALGGRPGACFARRLMLVVGNDTLLWLVRRRAQRPAVAPTVIGIDDWAWRRNRRYGTLVCDLERRQVVCLLPDREAGTAEAWLAGQPRIAVVARDRSGSYALAAARALPHAVQVADRWHLMENASRAFAEAVRRSMRAIRQVIGASILNPALLTAAERIQYEGYLRREDTNAAVLEQARAGMTIKQIVRHTGHSRGLVRQILRGLRLDVIRTREGSLELHLPWLDAQWAAGARNSAELWRRLKLEGFVGSRRVVGEWATRRRHADRLDLERLQRVPSARTLARLLCHGPRQRHQQGSWRRAVFITSPWSCGQVEGQITRLKLVKRQMYSRAKLDLLEARLVGTT